MSVVVADLAANVWKVLVAEGDEVSEGDVLMILESMKMEIPVESPASGTVRAIHVSEASSVDEGDSLAEIS